MARRAAAACALGLLLAVSGRAAAQEREPTGLERARAELADLRYGDAETTLEKALAAGTSGPGATAQLHLLLGEVRASLGQGPAAERAFRIALAIDPALQLRRGLSPKINRPFQRARKAQRAAPALAIAHRVVGRNPVVVAVVVEADPLGIVAAARVSYRGPDGAARSMASGGPVGGAPGKGGAARYDLELPHGVTRITVAAIDQHGNRVVELGTADAPLVLDVDPADQPADRRADGSAAAGEPLAGDDAAVGAALTPADRDRDDGATPFYASWILWGGVAVAAGAGGVWAGLSARSAVDELDDIRGTEFEVEFSDAQAIADRAERRSLIANVCFAGAGASAVVAGILFVRDLRRGPGPEAAASVAPVVGPDRVGVAASLRF